MPMSPVLCTQAHLNQPSACWLRQKYRNPFVSSVIYTSELSEHEQFTHAQLVKVTERAYRVVFPSRSTARGYLDALHEFPAAQATFTDKMEVLTNEWRDGRYHNRSNDDSESRSGGHNILLVSRLDDDKIDTKAFGWLIEYVRDNPNIRLHVVGDGELGAKLLHVPIEFGCNDRVSFHGFQTEIEPFYQSANVVVLTSKRESSPLVLNECLVRARALVAPAVGTLAELSQSDSVFVYRLDDRNDFVEQMHRAFVVDPKLYRASRKALIRKFPTEKQWARELMAIYTKQNTGRT